MLVRVKLTTVINVVTSTLRGIYKEEQSFIIIYLITVSDAVTK